MSDAPRIGRGLDADGERLPWLEPVEEERQDPPGPSMVKLIGLVLLGLVILAVIVGGYSWWSQQGATEGHGELIAAPPGPYKIRPPDPGGLEVEGEGDSAFAASAGVDTKGRIDMSAVPEEPVVMPAPKAKAAPAEGEAAPAETEEPPASGGGGIQLGAFSSEAAAASAWKALTARFRYLEPLAHSIIPVRTGDRTLYRLRASGPGAADICGRLRIAGETCVTVN